MQRLKFDLIRNPVIAAHQLTEEGTVTDFPKFQSQVTRAVTHKPFASRVEGKAFDTAGMAFKDLNFG
jgi:hypothetical protein